MPEKSKLPRLCSSRDLLSNSNSSPLRPLNLNRTLNLTPTPTPARRGLNPFCRFASVFPLQFLRFSSLFRLSLLLHFSDSDFIGLFCSLFSLFRRRPLGLLSIIASYSVFAQLFRNFSRIRSRSYPEPSPRYRNWNWSDVQHSRSACSSNTLAFQPPLVSLHYGYCRVVLCQYFIPDTSVSVCPYQNAYSFSKKSKVS